ncbi:MAG: GNAT family N-acetyltransferase [Gemmatimonadota bacterium]|nr:MAG: GNAT family N-acetyltransferase [Gemmatimonadota bacterium]
MEARHYTAVEILRDGESLLIRAIRPEDKALLIEMFERLTPQTIYYRFHGAKKRLSRRELIYLTELDFHRQAALVALLADDDGERIVGVGRWACPPNGLTDRAEVAFTVEDGEQGRGIGKLLLHHLMRVARAQGIKEFEAFVLAENVRMLELFGRTGLVVHHSAEDRACHLIMSIRADPSLPDSDQQLAAQPADDL